MILIRASRASGAVSVLHYSSTQLRVSECQHKLGNIATLVGEHNVNIDRTRLGNEHQTCLSRSTVCQLRTREQRWRMHQQPSVQLNRFFAIISFVILNKSFVEAHCVDGSYHQTTLQTSKPSKSVPNIHPLYDDEKVAINKKSSASNSHNSLSLSQSINQCACLLAPVWHSMQTRHFHISRAVQAGHNKWSKVKHKKKFTDLEKSTTIHKYVTLITSAIKVGPGGADPDSNVRLANIIESARKAGVPKANIESAIKHSSGKGKDSSSAELVVLDAQGPSGYHMIIETFTDNNRKTRPEIKNLLAKYSGILGEPGSSAFMFDHKGVIRVQKSNFDVSTDLLEVAIEVGAEDIQTSVGDSESTESSTDIETSNNEPTNEQLLVKFLCDPSELTKVSKSLKSLGYTITGASLEYIPKSLVYLSQESYENAVNLVCVLSEHSDVTEVYDNFALRPSTTQQGTGTSSTSIH